MIRNILKLDVNFNTTRTGTLSRFGTVNYYDLSISGISDYTKCVVQPIEIIRNTVQLPGYTRYFYQGFYYPSSYTPPSYSPGWWWEAYGGFVGGGYSPPYYRAPIYEVRRMSEYVPGGTVSYDGVGLTMSISNVVFGGSMELVSNSVLRFYFKSTYSTNTTAQGRLQIVEFK